MPTSHIVVAKMEKLAVPEAKGSGYSRSASEIEYSPTLARDSDGRVIVDVTQAGAREIARASGYCLPTAAYLQVLGERGYKDAAFDDNFARNSEKTYFWELTDTGLLKPKGKNIKAKNDRTYYLRIVTEGGKAVGELWVPEGNGRIVREWSPFGIPSETAQESEHKEGTETHFHFDPNLDKVAVLRDWYWRDAREDCFSLIAYCGPSDSHSHGGFRPVRGSVASYEKLVGEARKAKKPEKDSRDYRHGYVDGRKAGLDEGRNNARQEFARELEKLKRRFE
jgi:hypothetical protein